MQKINSSFTNLVVTFIISLTLFTGVLNAQIIYTDLIPDSTINANGEFYDLDLNNDGTIDFRITYTTSTAPHGLCTGTKVNHYIRVSPVDSTLDEVANVLYSSTYYPEPIKFDSLIRDSNYVWKNTASQLLAGTTWSCHTVKSSHVWGSVTVGKFNGTGNKYLGLRFKVGNYIYYGWAQLVITSASATILDYAYNSSAGQFIYAGQMSTEHLAILSITGSPFCVGSPVQIPYTVSVAFDSANVFTAQLSDSDGTFTNPVNIGNITSDTSGIINGTIPLTSVKSLLYRMRVVSSSPQITGNNNGINLMVDTTTPVTNISSAGLTTICPGQDIYLSASSAIENTYQWAYNGLNITNADNYQYQAMDSGVYRCFITNGCGTVLSDSIIVSFYPLPVATISPGTSLWICPGQSTIFTASPGPGYAYQWFRNGSSVTGNAQSYTAIQSGIYSVVVYDSIGCENTSNKDTLNISNPYSVLASIGPTSVCDGDSVLLIQNALSDTSFTYQWYLDSILIPNAAHSSYYAIVTGIYTLTVTNPYGTCRANSTGISVQVGCLGIKEVTAHSHFTLSPNPASHFINISNRSKSVATIQVINSAGELIYSDKVGTENKNIDISSFQNGEYFLKWYEGNYSEIKMFTIIR